MRRLNGAGEQRSREQGSKERADEQGSRGADEQGNKKLIRTPAHLHTCSSHRLTRTPAHPLTQMILPEPGLIVSCYLHSMKGMEKQLIETLWSEPLVKTLRIEGAENIQFAARLKDIEDKYIIGLIKDRDAQEKGRRYITNTPDMVKLVTDSGADMVAIDSRSFYIECPHLSLSSAYYLYSATSLPIMADINNTENAINAKKAGAIILSTTFQERGFDLAVKLVLEGWKVNVEGGLLNSEDIKLARETGAIWYTIGRAIHDPLTIIKHLEPK